MFAEYFSVEPSPARVAGVRNRIGMAPRLRQVHRWTSIIFTLTVVANFAALARGPVPAAITYSPLPPLLVLTLTGLYLFACHARSRRRTASLKAKG